MKRTLIIGLGYVGEALAQTLQEQGHDVVGARRSRPSESCVSDWRCCDVARPETLSFLKEESFDSIVYMVSAGGREEASYLTAYRDGVRNVLAAISEKPRFIYVSSTGVYGESDGGAVDENTSTFSSHFTGSAVRAGETLALQSGLESCCVRLGGIYGPGRTYFIRMAQEYASGNRPLEDGYTNRIHRDDAAGIIAQTLSLDAPLDVYNGVDTESALKSDVYQWICKQQDIAWEGNVIGPLGGKRVSSTRVQATGYQFYYPTFREGYASLLGN